MKTRCPQGHDYSADNTYVDKSGYRHCKTCRRERAKRRRAGGPGRGSFNANKTHCPKGHPYDEENTLLWKSRTSRNGLKRACATCLDVHNYENRFHKFGLTSEQVLDMLVTQGGCCAICRIDLPGKFYIDHDHACCSHSGSCGKCVRGILCSNCNTGLGRFSDSVELMLTAIEYLSRRPIGETIPGNL